MQNGNDVVLTGIIVEEVISSTFTKTAIAFNGKDKDGTWKQGTLESWIKPELMTNSGAQVGDTIRAKGFLTFNFWNDKSFPKFIVTEIQEVEKAQAGAQPQVAVQPTQPQGYAAGQPPVPGAAPQAPQPAAQAFAAPQVPQAPGMPPVPPIVPGQVPGMPGA